MNTKVKKERIARTKYPIKERIICSNCFSVFENNIKKIRVECPRCSKSIDARDRRGYNAEYKRKYPEKALIRLEEMKEYDKKYNKKRASDYRKRLRLTVLNIISKNNPVCVSCGCKDLRLLEINHIEGGGNKELQNGKNTNRFTLDIYSGRRKTDDLNLLCRVCNSLHYLELKFGKLPYKIKWLN